MIFTNLFFSIDTPGVIDRVSTLFRGHPNLIQGFNTFLPPGYRIECSLDPSDPNPIRVTTPTGTTTRPNINVNYNQNWGNAAGPTQQEAAAGAISLSGGAPGHGQGQPPIPPHQFVPQVAYGQPQEQQQQAGGQVEFNHAISYVNKIKTRFANQPDIYKQFLEILQTYQREQKPIGEVYEQVTVLFANSPDLLDDFKQFLPDTRSQVYVQQQEQENGYYGPGSQLPPVGNFPPPSATSGIPPFGAQPQFQQAAYPMLDNASGESIPSRPADHQEHHQPAPVPKDRTSVSEAAGYDGYTQESQYSGVRSSIQPVTKGKSSTPSNNKNAVVITNPTLVPGVPEPVPPSATVKSSSLLEEIGFFDKVKKALGNKQTYNEFLKVLNLFSQDIIDKVTLVERVDSFLGDGHADLLQWFKMFVGYEEKPQHIENITFKKHQLELSLCKAYGPSYRQLPKAETYMPCSGRDEMCWEVLNDEWVGHPTWASEDSGFIAHRKNQYEEILFKIEEERHEFDYYMESNLRTIQTLETIANRIANMTPEQKVNFKLPPGLGHTSSTIYKKVIRKIYDKDRGFEVVDALHENPAIAVPIVLKRLKQKDEEWKRSQREWNKVWREMEQKVFYKSLDHLGLTFKQADKKLLTAKQLVSEISTVKVEQQNKRLHPLTPKAQEQLNYEFKDNDVLMDILKLCDVFINKSSNYSVNDREKLSQFFRSFLSLFFGIPSETIESAMLDRSKEAGKSEGLPSQQSATPESSSSTEGSSKKRGREHDLLRDVLKKQSKSKKDETVDSPNHQSESDEQEYSEEIEKSGELWIKTTSKKFALKNNNIDVEKRSKYYLFGNTTIYVFFRHLRTLYERLVEIKAMNEVVGKEIRSRKVVQFAKDLNLISHQLEDLNIQLTGSKDCYKQLLDLSEKLIEGELEHQWFEETIRQGYRNKAYKIYTVDKVVQAIVKHMHTVVSDHKTSEMVVLFENDRSKPTSTAKDQILYRMQVRALMSTDENMFKISLDDTDNSVNIQFVSLDDLTINDHQNAEEKYNYYVTSYVMSHPTEGVKASKINMPFLKSFIENIDEDQCEGFVSAGLKVSVCENSYRLFFEADTHDEFTSNFVYQKPQDSSKSTRATKLEALKNLVEDKDFGWKLTLEASDDATALEEKAKILLTEGAEAYQEKSKHVIEEPVKESEGDVEMTDDKTVEEKETNSSEGNQADETAVKPDVTVDADMTVVQGHNDTTIQQEGNDTTADDVTVNQEDTTMFEDAHNTTQT